MSSRSTRFSAVCAAVLAFGMVGPVLIASGGCKDGHTDSIGRLLNTPDAFYDKDLTVAGKVTNRLDPTGGLLGFAAYQVDDGSGRIWVITRSGAPEVGREVGLKARLRHDKLPTQLSLPGADVVLLDEIERRTR